jgi:hypothetical protein
MQQLLDKWERLRKSEYLRPDEKLMLNHCISDLKRFMDHSGEATEMVGNRTAVDWFELELSKLFIKMSIDNYLFYILPLVIQAKEMEKERIENVWIAALDFGIEKMKGLNTLESKDAFEKFYKTTYGGNK